MEESNNPRVAISTDKSLNQINNLPFSLIKDDIPLIPDIPKNPDISRSSKGKFLCNLSQFKIEVVNFEEICFEFFCLDTSAIPDFDIPVNIPKELPIPVHPDKVSLKPILKPPKSENIIVSGPPETNQIVKKVSDIIGDSMKELTVEHKAEDEVKENDPVILKVEEKVKPIEEKHKIVDSPKKTDLINSDAIKKEDSELAADGELAQLEVAERHAELKKTLERHKMEQLELLQEQRELLKDIKEQQREFKKEQEERLAKDAELGKKSVQAEEKKEDKSIEVESKIEQNLITNEKSNIVENGNQLDVKEKNEPEEIKRDVQLQDPKTRKLNTEDKKEDKSQKISSPETAVKDIQRPLKTIIDNEALIGKLDDEKKLESNQGVEEKASDHILKALTIKKMEVEEVVKGNGEKQEENLQKNESILRNLTLNKDKETNRLQEYSIPIALKMSNQTKTYNDSGRLVTENKGDFSAVRRDILQNHEREKREAEDQVKFNETEVTGQNINYDGIRESCAKRDNDLSNEQMPVKEDPSMKQDMTKSLIKTNAYLSQQSFTEKISINPNLAISGEIVQLKKRDLKALKSGEDGGL